MNQNAPRREKKVGRGELNMITAKKRSKKGHEMEKKRPKPISLNSLGYSP